MKLWIRVDACTPRDPKVGAFAAELGVSVPTAVGHLVMLWGVMAEHTPDGSVGAVGVKTLEQWAGWAGKRGKFGALFLEHFASDGVVRGWADRQGALIKRMERDRNRHKPDPSTEIPRKRRGKSTSTVRNGTEQKDKPLPAPAAPGDGPNLFRLAPFLESWREKFGGDPPAARFGRVFKRLVITKGYGEAEVLRRWLICLAVRGDFATPEELAAKWDRYAGVATTAKQPSLADTLAVLSVEYELVARSDPTTYQERMRRALGDARVTDRAKMEAAIRLAKPWELGAIKREWLSKEVANRLTAGGFAA